MLVYKINTFTWDDYEEAEKNWECRGNGYPQSEDDYYDNSDEYFLNDIKRYGELNPQHVNIIAIEFELSHYVERILDRPSIYQYDICVSQGRGMTIKDDKLYEQVKNVIDKHSVVYKATSIFDLSDCYEYIRAEYFCGGLTFCGAFAEIIELPTGQFILKVSFDTESG